jgi:hypothetical protein
MIDHRQNIGLQYHQRVNPDVTLTFFAHVASMQLEADKHKLGIFVAFEM